MRFAGGGRCPAMVTLSMAASLFGTVGRCRLLRLAGGDSSLSDKPSDNDASQRQMERGAPRHRNSSDLR